MASLLFGKYYKWTIGIVIFLEVITDIGFILIAINN